MSNSSSEKGGRSHGPPADAGLLGLATASIFFRRLVEEGPRPAPGLMADKRVGDYRLVRVIGQGGMGQVWEAEQVSLGGRRVAIKFVRPERVTEKQLEYFQREARAGGRLHHRGIVTLYGYGEDADLAWIAMELVEGGWTLRDSIDELARGAEVPDDYDREVARFVAELAEAMQAAHDAGVIHRDLKPQNVLIGPDGLPRVSDFGLAKLTDESALSQTGEFAGTYFYSSPEQVAARRMGIDQRCDVFSLGVILYEMLALRRPFQGDTAHQVAAQILTKDPPDPRAFRSRIPRDLVVIANKALAKDPDRRYPTMAHLADDLRRHLAGDSILARPPSRIERIARTLHRHRTGSLVGALATIALAVVIAFLLRDLQSQRVLAAQGLDLGRLSALQDLERLIEEADRLWPAHPEHVDAYVRWIAEAEELVAGLHPDETDASIGHLAQRERLAARAQDAATDAADPRSHPRHGELELLRRKVAAMEQAARVRAGTAEASEAELAGELPDDAAYLTAWAQALARSGHFEYGREPEALAVARAAQAHVQDDAAYVAAMEALAWALLANGLDAAALEAAEIAIDSADPVERPAVEERKHALQATIEAAPAKLAEAQAELEALEAEVASYRPLRIADSRDLWWHERLSTLIAGLNALTEERTGLLSPLPDATSPEHGWSIPRRLAFARELERAYAPGGEYDVRWKTALPGLREAYPGLALDIRIGLVPLGPDPRSGLFEFWLPQSGAEPARAASGALMPAEDSGLVLVLLRGGRFSMGAQEADPTAENHDPMATKPEGPVHLVELSPFFLSKYELTQGQWLRLTGANPSNWCPAGNPPGITLRHPVETVSWWDVQRVLGWLGLELPSEAEWEFGCRAGSTRPWSWPEGAEPAAHANLADKQLASTLVTYIDVEPWTDGFGVHAPVGSFAPNAFGLHDLHGNVWEWCRDEFARDHYMHSDFRDPFLAPTGERPRVHRGGNYRETLRGVRSSWRDGLPPASGTNEIGARAALSFVPR